MLNLQQQYVKNSPCVVLCLFARSLFFFPFLFLQLKSKQFLPRLKFIMLRGWNNGEFAENGSPN